MQKTKRPLWLTTYMLYVRKFVRKCSCSSPVVESWSSSHYGWDGLHQSSYRWWDCWDLGWWRECGRWAGYVGVIGCNASNLLALNLSLPRMFGDFVFIFSHVLPQLSDLLNLILCLPVWDVLLVCSGKASPTKDCFPLTLYLTICLSDRVGLFLSNPFNTSVATQKEGSSMHLGTCF